MTNPLLIQQLVFEAFGFMISEDKVLIYVSSLTVFIFILKSSVAFMAQRFILRFSFGVKADLISRLSAKYLSLPVIFHQKNNVASIIQRIQGHTHIYIDRSLLPLMRGISELFVLIAIVSYLIYISPYIMFAALLLLIFTVSLYNFLLRKLYIVQGKKEILASEGIIQNIKEAITGIREIKTLKVESFFLNRIENNAKAQADSATKTQSYTILPRFVLESILIVFVVAVELTYFLNGYNMEEILPILGIFAVASFRLIPSINHISVALSQSSVAESAVNDLYEDLKKNIVLNDLGFKLEANQKELLMLNDISYSINNKKIFDKANLSLFKGDFIGIYGESGSGKTTLINIMSGLLSVDSGQIKYNSAYSNKETLKRGNVSIVDQTPLIINDSLKRNIALGVEDKDIQDGRIDESIRLANLEDFKNSIGGVEYILSADGNNISGGQKQRIAIARSIYSNREILIFDEPTSALDKETESKIFDLINNLSNIKTIIVVSHNIDFLSNCNKIYEVKEHKIYEK